MVNLFKQKLNAFISDQSGATAIEYSLIAGLIFLVIVTNVRDVADIQNDNYKQISDAIDEAVNQ